MKSKVLKWLLLILLLIYVLVASYDFLLTERLIQLTIALVIAVIIFNQKD